MGCTIVFKSGRREIRIPSNLSTTANLTDIAKFIVSSDKNIKDILVSLISSSSSNIVFDKSQLTEQGYMIPVISSVEVYGKVQEGQVIQQGNTKVERLRKEYQMFYDVPVSDDVNILVVNNIRITSNVERPYTISLNPNGTITYIINPRNQSALRKLAEDLKKREVLKSIVDPNFDLEPYQKAINDYNDKLEADRSKRREAYNKELENLNKKLDEYSAVQNELEELQNKVESANAKDKASINRQIQVKKLSLIEIQKNLDEIQNNLKILAAAYNNIIHKTLPVPNTLANLLLFFDTFETGYNKAISGELRTKLKSYLDTKVNDVITQHAAYVYQDEVVDEIMPILNKHRFKDKWYNDNYIEIKTPEIKKAVLKILKRVDENIEDITDEELIEFLKNRVVNKIWEDSYFLGEVFISKDKSKVILKPKSNRPVKLSERIAGLALELGHEEVSPDIEHTYVAEPPYKGFNIYKMSVTPTGSTEQKVFYFFDEQRGEVTNGVVNTPYTSLEKVKERIDRLIDSVPLTKLVHLGLYTEIEHADGYLSRVILDNKRLHVDQVISKYADALETKKFERSVYSEYEYNTIFDSTYKTTYEYLSNLIPDSMRQKFDELINDNPENLLLFGYILLYQHPLEYRTMERKKYEDNSPILKKVFDALETLINSGRTYYIIEGGAKTHGSDKKKYTIRQETEPSIKYTPFKRPSSVRNSLEKLARVLKNQFGVDYYMLSAEDWDTNFDTVPDLKGLEINRNVKAFIHTNSEGKTIIYINPLKAYDLDIMHEYAHLMAGVIKLKKPELYNEILNNILANQQYRMSKKKGSYKNVSQLALAEEVFADLYAEYLLGQLKVDANEKTNLEELFKQSEVDLNKFKEINAFYFPKLNAFLGANWSEDIKQTIPIRKAVNVLNRYMSDDSVGKENEIKEVCE